MTLLLFCFALANPSQQIKEESVSKWINQTFEIVGHKVNYDVYLRSKDYDLRYVSEVLRVSSQITFNYISMSGMKTYCDRTDKLEVYGISFDELNKKTWIVQPELYPLLGNIYGLYDPNGKDVDLIWFTLLEPNTTHLPLAHEFAHFWYQKLCLEYNSSYVSSENFAKKIEELYFNYWK